MFHKIRKNEEFPPIGKQPLYVQFKKYRINGIKETIIQRFCFYWLRYGTYGIQTADWLINNVLSSLHAWFLKDNYNNNDYNDNYYFVIKTTTDSYVGVKEVLFIGIWWIYKKPLS
jgi:hypothetical protein